MPRHGSSSTGLSEFTDLLLCWRKSDQLQVQARGLLNQVLNTGFARYELSRKSKHTGKCECKSCENITIS